MIVVEAPYVKRAAATASDLAGPVQLSRRPPRADPELDYFRRWPARGAPSHFADRNSFQNLSLILLDRTPLGCVTERTE
jgi:hypothetical protein